METDMDCNPVEQDAAFRYMLLDRMRGDCDYYLGRGDRQAKYLWARSEQEQIETMKAIWNSFSEDEKPAWLSMEQICDYEEKMLGMEGQAPAMTGIQY